MADKVETGETSPVRPVAPEALEKPTLRPHPPQPILPHTRETTSAIGSVEERLEAETALEKLRQKTAAVAAEFAAGRLNRAQFVAMYAHYNEKRVIIERLLARDPGTQAWQSVARSGHTGFLKEHYEARVLSYGVYDLVTSSLINSQGVPLLPADMTSKILMAIRIVMRNHERLNAQRKRLENGQWAVFIPGKYTVGVVVFSIEPSVRQITLVDDLHRDFERANRHALERSVRNADELVFPYRALFEKQG